MIIPPLSLSFASPYRQDFFFLKINFCQKEETRPPCMYCLFSSPRNIFRRSNHISSQKRMNWHHPFRICLFFLFLAGFFIFIFIFIDSFIRFKKEVFSTRLCESSAGSFVAWQIFLVWCECTVFRWNLFFLLLIPRLSSFPSVYLSVYVCLPIFLSIYLSAYVGLFLSVCLSFYPSICQSSIYGSVSVWMSVYLSVLYLSIYLPLCLPVYLSPYPSFFLTKRWNKTVFTRSICCDEGVKVDSIYKKKKKNTPI